MALALKSKNYSCEWVGDLSEEELDIQIDFTTMFISRGINERLLRVTPTAQKPYHVLMKSDDRFLNELATTGNADIAFVCCAGRSFLLNANRALASPIAIVPTISVSHFSNGGLCVAGFHEIVFIASNLSVASVTVRSPEVLSGVNIIDDRVELNIEGGQFKFLDVAELEFQLNRAILDDLDLVRNGDASL